MGRPNFQKDETWKVRIFATAKVSENRFYNGTACIESTRAVHQSGHCIIKYNGKAMGHHLLAYFWEHGVHDTSKWIVHHLCENKKCINHLHLKKEPWRSHSSHHNRGSNNPAAILTEVDIPELKKLHGVLPIKVISAMMGVSESCISAVLNGRTFKEIQ